MITISNQIRDLAPDSWYKFAPIDVNIKYSDNGVYGVDADNSAVFNTANANYFIPRWNRPILNFKNYDKDILSNQLADSEFLIETDASFFVGRNKSKVAGLNLKEYTDEIETLDDVIRKVNGEEWREYLFQFRGSSNALTYNYLTFDYTENTESYVPIVYDTKVEQYSFPVTDRYSNKFGKYEVWSTPFNVPKIENDGFGNPQDMRELVFKIINPVTGKEFPGTKKMMFYREGDFTSLNSDEVPYIENPNNLYDQQEMNYDDDRQIRLVDIFAEKNARFYRMKENNNVNVGIPQADMIHFLVFVPYLSKYRSLEFSEQKTTVSNNDTFMYHLGFRWDYDISSRTVRVYDAITGLEIPIQFSAPADNTRLIYIKAKYERQPGHNPGNNNFRYNMLFEFKDMGNPDFVRKYTREITGGIRKINYKGIQEVDSIPSFDCYPLMLGHMPIYNYRMNQNMPDDRKTIRCKLTETGSGYKDIVVLNKLKITAPYSISAIDNICYFDNRDILTEVDKLYNASFKEGNGPIDKTLSNYWPMEIFMAENLKTTPNLLNSSENSMLDHYGFMKFTGWGKTYVEKEENHSVLNASIRFDGNIRGNSNIPNTWSNSRNYSINFWFKSSQKKRGVILCDMDKEPVTAVGVYIGVSSTGTLEVGFNSRGSRIYPNINITDNVFHMITIVVQQEHYQIWVDGKIVDQVLYVTAGNNKSGQYNYNIFFMGHPLGNNTAGNLARIGFYKTRLNEQTIFEMYQGDVEHRIYGTVLASNMPFETEVRFFNWRTGEYIKSAYSSRETGQFVYRNYDGMSVHLMVVNNNRKHGLIEVMGPLSPQSVEP